MMPPLFASVQNPCKWAYFSSFLTARIRHCSCRLVSALVSTVSAATLTCIFIHHRYILQLLVHTKRSPKS